VERVFVDTNTLYPISVADLVLRLAEAGMFDLIWSDHLLAEVERVLVDRKGLSLEAASYFCDCVRRAFPDGRVAPELYLPLVASRTGPDPGDHVHSAAAVAGGATVVLSADRRGYPNSDIVPARRRDPDTFLTGLLRRHSAEVLSTVEAMGADLRTPLTGAEVLDRLARAGLRRFVALAAGLR
jgi:hypothetical protein